MGYLHKREDMLEAAVALARAEGLGALSFGRIARIVGTNDRTVVYYFPSKSDLMGAVLDDLGRELQDLLAGRKKRTSRRRSAMPRGVDVDPTL